MPSSLPKRERERGGGKEEGRGRGRERETFEGLAGIPTPSLPSPPAERSIYSKFQVAAHAIPCRTIVPGNQFPRRSLSLSPQRQLNRIPLREFMRQRSPPPPPPRPSDVFAEKLEKRSGLSLFLLAKKKEERSCFEGKGSSIRSSYPAKFESNSKSSSHSIRTVLSKQHLFFLPHHIIITTKRTTTLKLPFPVIDPPIAISRRKRRKFRACS